MNKINCTIVALLTCLILSCQAQTKKKVDEYSIAFYNVENLFDTYDDPKTYDDDFTPNGSYRYTENIYLKKLHNIATVISQLADGEAPTVIGLAEVENNIVINDLINQPELKTYDYKYVWYNSPDPRGIDVALLYQTDRFKVLTTKSVPIKFEEHKNSSYRDILYVEGIMATDTLAVLVNHWPSRREGVKTSEHKRIAAAKANTSLISSALNKNIDVIVMGDFNDNPTDISISKHLSANGKDLYNPWQQKHNKGEGTSVYHRQWDHFDQILISKSLLDHQQLHYTHAEIFDEAFIRNKNHGDDAYPFRSFRGRQFINGYSDHLPVVLYLAK